MNLAAAMATGIFNDGHVFVGKVLNWLGYHTGQYTIKAMEKADEERVRKAKQEAKEQTKADRKSRKRRKHQNEDQATEKEGVMYEPGGFGPDGSLLQIETPKDATAKQKKTAEVQKVWSAHEGP